MHELDSARAKLKRANIHINALDRSVQRFTASGKNVRVSDFNFKGTHQIYHINPVALPSWGLIAGDTLTNLRASLDHIAWALAMKHGIPNRPKQVQFPIFETGTEYNNRANGTRGILAEVLPAAHPVIESLQPYHSADWP